MTYVCTSRKYHTIILPCLSLINPLVTIFDLSHLEPLPLHLRLDMALILGLTGATCPIAIRASGAESIGPKGQPLGLMPRSGHGQPSPLLLPGALTIEKRLRSSTSAQSFPHSLQVVRSPCLCLAFCLIQVEDRQKRESILGTSSVICSGDPLAQPPTSFANSRANFHESFTDSVAASCSP